MTGNIVLDDTAKAAMASTPAKAEVAKKDTFTEDAPTGYMWVRDGEGKQTLAQIVAKIDDETYSTLEAAFAAAVDGDTITVLANCAGNGIKAPQGKFNTTGLTVDFGNHTYTVDGTTVGSTGTETNGFQLLKNNKITFKNGTITSTKAKILIQNYSDLTLDNMTLTLNNPNYTSAYTLSNNNGNTTIKDTTINANEAGGFAFDVCRYASYPSVSVTVTGDSEINGNVEVYASGSDAKDGFSLNLESGTMTGNIVVDSSANAAMASTPEKAKVVKEDAFVEPAPADYEWVDNGDGTSTLVAIEYAAQIGNTKYRTVGAAFAEAKDGDTITLLANSTGGGIKVMPNRFNNNGLTVDFNGYTYTIDRTLVGSPGYETQAFHLEKNNKITLKNGTITSDNAYMLVQNYSDLTLDKMTLTPDNPNYSKYYTLSNNNGNIVIKDTTINANPAGGFAFDVCRFSSYPSVSVTVTGNSTINGDVEVSASGSNAKDGFSLNLESGTMSGNIVVDASANAAMASTPEKAKVVKKNAFEEPAPADYEWVDNGDGTSTLVAIEYAAQIGNTKYRTVGAAFAEAKDGDTITLLANSTGGGIKVMPNRFNNNGLTVDFNGYTYTIDRTLVGSPGYETQAFHLEKNNKITLKNGTITSDNAYMLVQNYSDLTLDKMTLTPDNPNYSKYYTLSNNNGNIVIKDTTINANPAGGFAFDVCRFSSYPSVSVTVTGNSTINGDVEVSASGSNAKDGFSLNLESGTMSGNIVLDDTAKAALAATPEKASVNKATTFTKDAPDGYEWVDKGDGKQTLELVKELFARHSVSLNGDIGVNFYIYPAAKDIDMTNVDSATVKFSFDKYTDIPEVDLTEITPTVEGWYKVTCNVPAAYMAHEIKAEVYFNGDGDPVGTDYYSVQDYAQTVLANPSKYDSKNPEKLTALVKEMLNYGSKAQDVFQGQMKGTEKYDIPDDYVMATVEASDIQAAIVRANPGKTATDMSTVVPESGASYYTTSLIFLSESTLRHYFKIPKGSANDNAYDGNQEQYYYWVEKTDIPAAELDTLQKFKVNDVTFYYSALDYAKAVVESNMSGSVKQLAKALYLYNQAANAYFG